MLEEVGCELQVTWQEQQQTWKPPLLRKRHGTPWRMDVILLASAVWRRWRAPPGI